MWATAAITLLAIVTGASAYTVDVVVPAEPAYGSTVRLECNYRLESGEFIERMSWLKDGQEFLVYRQRPEELTWQDVSGLNVRRDDSSERLVILDDVQDSASGSYGVRMSITTQRRGSTSSTTYSHDQDMVVGGEVADTLGNRFGGTPSRRPGTGSTSTTTFTSTSTSSGGTAGVPLGGADIGPLGNRFGGGAAAAAPPPVGAVPVGAVPVGAVPVGAIPPAGAASVAVGLQQAQKQLENAVNQLNNAVNAAING